MTKWGLRKRGGQLLRAIERGEQWLMDARDERAARRAGQKRRR